MQFKNKNQSNIVQFMNFFHAQFVKTNKFVYFFNDQVL